LTRVIPRGQIGPLDFAPAGDDTQPPRLDALPPLIQTKEVGHAPGQQHQHGDGWCLINQQIQPFEGRGVCPVQVFQDKEYRLMFSQFQEDGDDGFEGLLALSLG